MHMHNKLSQTFNIFKTIECFIQGYLSETASAQHDMQLMAGSSSV